MSIHQCIHHRPKRRQLLLALSVTGWLLCTAPGAAQQPPPQPGTPPPGMAPPAGMQPPAADGNAQPRGDAEHNPALAYAFAVVSSILVLLLVCYPTRKQ